MKTKIFLLITFLTFLCRASESVIVDCKFGDGYTWGYTCEVQNSELITSKDDREISEVRGQHKNGKSNDDVKYFYTRNKKVSFFPIITKVFKNVNVVRISNKKDLKEITREDLKQFGGKLKRLELYGTSIEVIVADLFEDNQNLEGLELNGNNIRHIEDGALTKLKKISYFNFYDNPCKELSTMEETEKACKDQNYVPRICKNPIALQNEISTLTQKFDSTSNDLKAQMKENEKLKAEKEKIVEKVSQLENEKSKVDEENQNLKIKSEQEMEAHEHLKRELETKIASLEEKINKQKVEKSKLSEENSNLKAFTKKLNETFDETLKVFDANFTNFELIKREQETKISSLEEKISQQKAENEAKVLKLEGEILKIVEDNRKLKVKIEHENKSCEEILKAFEEKFSILSKVATKMENFETKLTQIPSNFASIEAKLDQQSSNLMQVPSKVDESSKKVFGEIQQEIKAQHTKLEGLLEIPSKLASLDDKIDHQKIDLATIKAKIDQQSSNFESQFDQIPSKVVEDSKKIFYDIKESQEKVFESKLSKLAGEFKNLTQTMNTMGEKIQAKVKEFCSEPTSA